MSCDFCGENRKAHRHVRIGAEDTASMCFICDREGQRGRQFSRKHGGYIDAAAIAAARDAAEEARQMEGLRSHPDTTPADLEDLRDIPF
jgi:hypothetical protein